MASKYLIFWWSRSESNRRPLECHSNFDRYHSINQPSIFRHFSHRVFRWLADVSIRLPVNRHNSGTEKQIGRLSINQVCRGNCSAHQEDFQECVETVSVFWPYERSGDGNGSAFKVSLLRARSM